MSGRIQQLLKQGEYAPQSVLDAARENAVKEHAQALAFMHSDMAEGVAESGDCFWNRTSIWIWLSGKDRTDWKADRTARVFGRAE